MRTISKLHFNRIIYGTNGQISEINKNDCIEDVFVCDTITVYEKFEGTEHKYKMIGSFD